MASYTWTPEVLVGQDNALYLHTLPLEQSWQKHTAHIETRVGMNEWMNEAEREQGTADPSNHKRRQNVIISPAHLSHQPLTKALLCGRLLRWDGGDVLEKRKLGSSPGIYYPLLGERGTGKEPKYQMSLESIECSWKNLRSSKG